MNYKNILVILSMMILSVASYAVKLNLSQTQVTLGETFTLTIKSSDDLKVDLKPLAQNFFIESRMQFFETGMRLTSGQTKGQAHRVHLLKLQLRPKRIGELTVPALKIDGTWTEPMTIKVIESDKKDADLAKKLTDESLWVEVTIDPKNFYIHSEVLCKVRVFLDDHITWRGLQIDKPEVAGTWSEVGKVKEYTKQFKERTYQVLEKTYLLRLTESGEITIPAFQITAVAYSTDIHDMTGLFFQPQHKHYHAQSKPQVLSVKPKPETIAMDRWFPAEQLSIKQEWAKPLTEAKVNEPIMRTITLEAKGLSAEYLPEVVADSQPAIKVYVDKPELKNYFTEELQSKKVIQISYLPTQRGEIKLPAVDVAWWNTTTEQIERATLPSLSMHVTAGASGYQNREAFIHAPASIEHSYHYWMWGALGAVGLWILTIMMAVWIWWKRRKKLTATKEPDSEKKWYKQVMQKASAADPMATRHALLGWAQYRWPNVKITTLIALAEHIKDDYLSLQLRALEAYLYERESKIAWDPKALVEALKCYLRGVKKKQKTPGLPPLNPS